jgi:predicted GH43/DUF377 family glycosyl hydrolase
MERTVSLCGGQTGIVTLQEPVLRYPQNPIMTCHQVNEAWTAPHLRVVTAHNAGVTRFGSETILLFRSHLRCGISVLGLARSDDGITGWRVDPSPLLTPASPDDTFGPRVIVDDLITMESGGVEDPRINPVDTTFALTYSAYHALVRNRVRVALATTTDFRSVTRHGPMLPRDMRNVVLFPKRIGGRYIGLFRPNDSLPGDTGGIYQQIHIGYAEDFQTGPWNIQETPIMRTGGGPSAFSDKIGPGAPPILTKYGWLSVFHGVRTTMDGNPYVLGVALHDRDRPASVRMSSVPILFPAAADCRTRETDYVHVPNVVFSCGALLRPDGTILIYYGGNDTVMNVAFSHEDVLAELCFRYGQDPLTGRLKYDVRTGAPISD